MYNRISPSHVEALRQEGALLLGVKSKKRKRQYTRIPAEVRFMDKVEKHEGGCWYWVGGKYAAGYGCFARVDGTKPELAHRSSYIMFVGEIPEGMFLLHKCDNPACVNPDHLTVGTQADNVADMVAKGRTRSNLTHEQIREIRGARGEKARDVAARFGLKSHKSVLNIWHGRTFGGIA